MANKKQTKELINLGDRFDLRVRCAYCGVDNFVWYAPTCGSDTFACEACKQENFITKDFLAKKIEDVNFIDIKDGFLAATNVIWAENEIERMCTQRLKDIKKKMI